METQKKKYFEEELGKIYELRRNDEFPAAVREAGRLFEELLKDEIQYFLSRVPFEVRKIIFECESEIGKGTKGINDFTLGQIIGIWRKAKLCDAVAEVEQLSARPLSAIDLNLICDLRNDCVHNAATLHEHEVDYVISSLKTFLGFFGVNITEKVSQRPKSIAALSELMQQSFSSVEVIEGTAAFYSRLVEIVSIPGNDSYDVTFLVENPPNPGRLRGTNNSTTEYFNLVKKNVLAGDARLRRIVTFNNKPKTAWILFNMIGSYRSVFEDNLILATFDASRSHGLSDILIPNIALYYSSQELSDGIAWIYSHQKDDNQNFIGMSGKSLFSTMRRLYTNWFKSCDRLTEARAVEQYTSTFGDNISLDFVAKTAMDFKDSIQLNDEELDGSIEYWASLLAKYGK